MLKPPWIGWWSTWTTPISAPLSSIRRKKPFVFSHRRAFNQWALTKKNGNLKRVFRFITHSSYGYFCRFLPLGKQVLDHFYFWKRIQSRLLFVYRLPKPTFEPSAEGLASLMDMSFTRAQATRALKETGNNVERAGRAGNNIVIPLQCNPSIVLVLLYFGLRHRTDLLHKENFYTFYINFY